MKAQTQPQPQTSRLLELSIEAPIIWEPRINDNLSGIIVGLDANDRLLAIRTLDDEVLWIWRNCTGREIALRSNSHLLGGLLSITLLHGKHGPNAKPYNFHTVFEARK